MKPRAGAVPERREQILGAAREVFGENGYERATVASIVERAGVAQGTFYLYFSSKQAVPTALAEELIRRMASAAEERSAGAASLPEALAAVVEAVCAEAEDLRDVLVVANRGTDLVADEGEWRRVTAPLRSSFEGCLRRWQQAGEADPSLDPDLSARVVVSMLVHTARAVVVFGDERCAPEVIRMLTRSLEAR